MNFHPASALDYLPRPELEQLQLSRLQTMLARVYERVPLMRSRMDERKVKPRDIGSLSGRRAAGVYGEDRSARHLSLRSVCQPNG